MPYLRRRNAGADADDKVDDTHELMSSETTRSTRLLRIFSIHHRRRQRDPEKARPAALFPNTPNAVSSIAGPRPSLARFPVPEERANAAPFPSSNTLSSIAGPRRTNIAVTEDVPLKSFSHKPEARDNSGDAETTTARELATIGDQDDPSITLAGRDSTSSYRTADPEGPENSEDPRDPFNLIAAYKDPTELKQIKIKARKYKIGEKLAAYHAKQNELILNLLKPMEEHTIDAQDEKDAARLPVQIAIYASLIANFSLCVLQMYAAISALSLSLLATGIDSVFDIGSNLLLFYLHRRAAKLDTTRWPVGGVRLETIGNIVYGFLMGSVNLVVIVESVQDILTHTNGETKLFHLPSVISVGSALGVKLILFLYCFSIRKYSSQVQVLWEDHRNDLWINTFGVLMSTGGSKLRWWLDPMGAIIIAVGIVIAWSKTIYSQFCLLAGRSAPNEFLQLLVYKTMTYSKDIEKVDTVRAYHSGPDYFVEIDIVMSPDTPLSRAHDLGQRLQDEIEVLPNVERAFVHVDHEATHLPEHRK